MKKNDTILITVDSMPGYETNIIHHSILFEESNVLCYTIQFIIIVEGTICLKIT